MGLFDRLRNVVGGALQRLGSTLQRAGYEVQGEGPAPAEQEPEEKPWEPERGPEEEPPGGVIRPGPAIELPPIPGERRVMVAPGQLPGGYGMWELKSPFEARGLSVGEAVDKLEDDWLSSGLGNSSGIPGVFAVYRDGWLLGTRVARGFDALMDGIYLPPNTLVTISMSFALVPSPGQTGQVWPRGKTPPVVTFQTDDDETDDEFDPYSDEWADNEWTDDEWTDDEWTDDVPF